MTLGALASGCGGGGGGSSAGSTSTTTTGETPVVQWADSFCKAFTSWQDQLTTIGKDVVSSPSKDGLQKAANDVKTANQTLADDLKALGKPDTPSGDKVQQSVSDLSTTLNTQVTDIEDAAKNASGITGIASAITSISASITTMGNALASTVTTINNADAKGEMKTAFDQAPSCSKFRSS